MGTLLRVAGVGPHGPQSRGRAAPGRPQAPGRGVDPDCRYCPAISGQGQESDDSSPQVNNDGTANESKEISNQDPRLCKTTETCVVLQSLGS